MTWYAASVLIAIIPNERQPRVPVLVYENVILVEAANAEEAGATAKTLALEEEALEDQLTIDGKHASRSFLGIRKLIEVSNRTPLNPAEDRPMSGTEITYSLFEVDADALDLLATGKSVDLTYVE